MVRSAVASLRWPVMSRARAVITNLPCPVSVTDVVLEQAGWAECIQQGAQPMMMTPGRLADLFQTVMTVRDNRKKIQLHGGLHRRDLQSDVISHLDRPHWGRWHSVLNQHISPLSRPRSN